MSSHGKHCDLPAEKVTVLPAEGDYSLNKAPEAVRDAMSRKGGSKVMLVG